ncbi:MAG: polysaccharide pyruvyl transferase family protein [Acutalibacteraceae bacterium]|nr:polysaccharide pyruvyl transferase family protein [Acutalibacteraceae bacterium]
MIYFINNGASANHGCEAIIRSSKKIINDEIILLTNNFENEKKYGIDKILKVENDSVCAVKGLKRFLSKVYFRIKKSSYLTTKYSKKELLDKVHKDDIFVSIGGDNYCYNGYERMSYLNRAIRIKGGKTVLWGCSVDEGEMPQLMKDDLSKFDLITARESISYEILKKLNKNTVLVSDPAFILPVQKCALPEGFEEKNTVGINLSPLVLNCVSDSSVIEDNYIELINYIIENTDMKIALLPHVVVETNDDRIPLKRLYEKFKDTGRVIMIEDNNCMVLKYYISKMKYFIGARTHATIAAYSSYVPTLVVGYSTKSKGIAKDLFGTSDNYVLNIYDMKSKTDLTNNFKWIMKNEDVIKNTLDKIMPEYVDKAYNANLALQKTINNN